ncbi:hypothetical protein Pcinc_019023 [Petrolisthes cinctipes]|uniref:Uncharacterized protein n=1 Tax=Petrolisthes cinctipes TaxID=88211 RepID=A0AAE1KLQ6_PETCI|nr:hypothetical protein Pcinc_019023 [Petrolisthes cinctipes]
MDPSCSTPSSLPPSLSHLPPPPLPPSSLSHLPPLPSSFPPTLIFFPIPSSLPLSSSSPFFSSLILHPKTSPSLSDPSPLPFSSSFPTTPSLSHLPPSLLHPFPSSHSYPTSCPSSTLHILPVSSTLQFFSSSSFTFSFFPLLLHLPLTPSEW